MRDWIVRAKDETIVFLFGRYCYCFSFPLRRIRPGGRSFVDLVAKNRLATPAGGLVGGLDFICRMDLPVDVSGKLAET